MNPTRNIDLTTLTDLAGIRIYKDGLVLTTYAADAPGTRQCAIFRLAEGAYNFNVTAINEAGGESVFSNTLRKIESRLRGPSGGRIIRDIRN